MIFDTPYILLHIEHPMKLMIKAVYTRASVAYGWAGAVIRVRKLHGEKLNRVTDRRTDGRTDRLTDRVTYVESRGSADGDTGSLLSIYLAGLIDSPAQRTRLIMSCIRTFFDIYR